MRYLHSVLSATLVVSFLTGGCRRTAKEPIWKAECNGVLIDTDHTGDYRGICYVKEVIKGKRLRFTLLTPGADFIIQPLNRKQRACDSRDLRKLRRIPATEIVQWEGELTETNYVVTIFKAKAKGLKYKLLIEEVRQ